MSVQVTSPAIPPILGRGRLDWEPSDASAALCGRDIASRDLVFVGSKGRQDFGLLAFRDFEKIQRPTELRRNLIELYRRDPQVSVRLLKTERRAAGFGGRELEGPTGNVADPERPHELEAGQPLQVLGVPFPQLRVLRLLADDGVLHDGVAKMVYHRRDGENAAQPLVRLFSGLVCLPCAYALFADANAVAEAAVSAPATTLRLVREVETVPVIVTSLVMGSGRRWADAKGSWDHRIAC